MKIIENSGLNKIALGLGGLVGLVTLVSTYYLSHEYSQPIIFLTLLGSVLWLMNSLTKHIPDRKLFLFSCAAVFLFRVIPSPVEPVEWFIIESLKLNESFFLNLRLISTLVSTILLLSASKFITKMGVKQTLILCTILDLISNLPMIGVYYKLIPFNPEYVLYLDSAFSSTIGSLSMIPLHVLLCSHTPEENKSTYIALTASFSNAALMAGELITKQLNKIYVVSQVDFSELGNLLISCLSISFILSITGIIFLVLYKKNDKL